MTLRIWAGAALLLLAAYFALRAAAANCSGGACDNYIPFSALVPLLVLAADIGTSVVGLRAARGDHAWASGIALATVLSFAGPLVALAVLRDRPDALVPIASALLAVVPVTALGYSFTRR